MVKSWYRAKALVFKLHFVLKYELSYQSTQVLKIHSIEIAVQVARIACGVLFRRLASIYVFEFIMYRNSNSTKIQ